MSILILTFLMVVASAGAVQADPLQDGFHLEFQEFHQTAILGGFNQADNDDYDEEEAGELRDWHEAKALYARGGIASWTAVFGENFGSGYGLVCGYAFGRTPNLIIRATTGYHTFTADTVAGARSDADASVAILPVMLGADYLLSSQGALRPFVGGAVGAVFLLADFNDIDASFFPFSDLFEPYLALQARAGVSLLRRGSNFGLLVGGSYNMIMDDLSEFAMDVPGHHDFFELGAGITYFFPEF